MKKRLLAVQGPLQFIAGLIAMDWFAKSQGDDARYETVLLMYDFLMPEELERDFAAVITRLAGVAIWQKTVFMTGSRMKAIMQGSYVGSIAKLQAEIGETRFDEIFLARDFCGDGSPLIGNAYPGAQKIMYGDSLGLVADRTLFSDFDANRRLRSTLSACKRFARRALMGGHRRFAFDTAVLSLPLDLSRGEIEGLRLLVPSKRHVQETVAVAAAALDDLRAYCAGLLASANGAPCHLFLLSNLSASGLMSEENEIAMYLEVIRRRAAPGDAVFLKVHPRSTRRVLDAVVAGLGETLRVKLIDDVRLARLPVELWSDLIAASDVVAVFSTAAVNIKYIYDKQVVLPLDDELIESHVYPHKVGYIKEIQEMIKQSVAAVDSWDGQSVLWKKYR